MSIALKIFRLRRVLGYFQTVYGLGVLLLVFDRFGWEWLLYLSPVIALAVWAVYEFDRKHGLPAEAGVNLRDNPEWRGYMKRFEAIERCIIGCGGLSERSDEELIDIIGKGIDAQSKVELIRSILTARWRARG